MGTYQVAGHQVAINFAAMTFMVPLGISMAISVRVGNAVGRRDAPGVRFSARVGTGLALGFQAVAAMVMLLFPRAVARLYTSDPRVVAVAAELLVLAALFQLSDGVQASAAGALRGVRDTRIPMAIVVVAYWLIGLPLGWWLAFGLGLGARGLWMGLIAGLTAAAALLAVRFHRVAARPLPP
jgi:MATE family multidrug resistance protein